MYKRILAVAATMAEAGVIGRIRGCTASGGGFRLAGTDICVLVAGVGAVPTAWEMQKWISSNGSPDLAVNLGIAGSFRDEIGTGEVVLPFTDCFADSGVEDGTAFLTVFEAGLAGKNDFPFTDGRISAPEDVLENLGRGLRRVNAITVNMATGSEVTRDRLFGKFNPDIETMEGATFFYICRKENIPFIALRSVSNMVGKRDKSGWNIQLALDNLAYKLEEVIINASQ